MSAPTLTLHKYHGVGNDFLVAIDPPAVALFDAALAQAVCDRHRGVGADGLILVVPAHGTDAFRFLLWNADGSDAEMSGNGIRCAAHALLDACAIEWRGAEPVEVSFATAAGPRVVTARLGADATTMWGSVAMGTVVLDGQSERCNVGHGQLQVNVGNPHLVVLGPDPATVDVAGLGATLDAAEPGGRNVEFVTLGPGADEVTMRVWERGVGETLACGTGSCAAAAAMHHWGRTGRAVTVHQPGGSVAVELLADGTAILHGPSQRIARCDLLVSDIPLSVAAVR